MSLPVSESRGSGPVSFLLKHLACISSCQLCMFFLHLPVFLSGYSIRVYLFSHIYRREGEREGENFTPSPITGYHNERQAIWAHIVPFIEN